MGPNGSEKFKTLLLQISGDGHFSFQWSSQNCVGDFWNFKFPIFGDFFFENIKFTNVPNRETKNLSYVETSIIWKTSDRRAKRGEIWDLWVLVKYTSGTFGNVVLKVMWESFCGIAM